MCYYISVSIGLCHFHEEMYMKNYKGADDTELPSFHSLVILFKSFMFWDLFFNKMAYATPNPLLLYPSYHSFQENQSQNGCRNVRQE